VLPHAPDGDYAGLTSSTDQEFAVIMSVPKELKDNEYRVALTHEGTGEFLRPARTAE
jgi:hypothetical protein